MPVVLTCPRGHSWELADDEPTREAGRPIPCPVCAAAPEPAATTDDPGATRAEGGRPAVAPPLPDVAGYEITGILGRGGMGIVYKAWQTSLKRPVALKMVLAGAHADEEQLARFKAEAEAAASLQHPNIVQIHEIAEHQGLPYFSLEFVGGGSLSGRLAGAPLPPETAARLIETLARAVQAAHDRGIVHRDLKPANILLTGGSETVPRAADPLGDCVPKITDFGLAKRLDVESARTQSGAIMGTPSYMAPEQAAGQVRDVGPLADVYALGAILYECLTGRPPFRAATPLETVRQVVQDEPVPPRRLQPRTPRDLETICLKCLHKEPARRYTRATELADDLHRFRAGEPIRARPASLLERAWKWSWRRPAAAALIAVSLLALSAATAAAFVYTADLRDRAESDRQQMILADDLRRKAEKGESDARAAAAIARQQTGRANDAAAKEREASLKATRDNYDLRVYRVVSALENGRHADAVDDLLQMRPENCNGHDLRGLEWHYWDRLLNAQVGTIRPKSNYGVRGLAYSPGGRLLVYEQGGFLTFLSANTRQFRAMIAATNGLNDLAFSPDGRFVAACGSESHVLLYDLGRPEKELALDGSAVLRLPPAQRLQAHDRMVWSVAFSPDGQQLASAGWDGRVVIWDMAQRKSVKILYGPRNGYVSVAFRPDGLRLAAVHGSGFVHAWELPTYKRLAAVSVPGSSVPLQRLAYSPDGSRLVAGDIKGRLHVWLDDAARYDRVLTAHKDAIRVLRFSRDGSRLVSAGEDRTVRLWDGQFFAEEACYFGHSATVMAAAFRPDGRCLASADNRGRIQLWDPARNPVVNKLPHGLGVVNGIAFSPDARRVAAVTHTGDLELFDVGQRRCDVTVSALDGELLTVAWQPRGTIVAVAGAGGAIRLRDGGDGREVRTLTGHRGAVRAVAFIPDGTLLASGGDDGFVRLWDVASGTMLHVLDAHPTVPPRSGTVRALAFHPGGKRLASVGYDARLCFWDVERGVKVAAHQVPGTSLSCVAFDRTGDFLAYGTHADSAVRLCSVKDGFDPKNVHPLYGHHNRLMGVAFTPDGRRLLSASEDGTIRLWDRTTFKDICSFGGIWNGVSALAVSDDGRFLAGGGRGLSVWDATPRGE